MDRAKLWRTTAKIAWRDLRNSGARPLFIVAVLAATIASVSGVHAAAQAARKALQGDARAWLAGDVCIDTREPIDRDQVRALDGLRSGDTAGVDWTLMTTLLTTASSTESADAGLIQVKAVDPAAYPFYGAIGLDPPLGLKQALHGNSIAVSDEVLQRFAVHVGDSIAIGGRPFRISAVIQSEPDRFANEAGLGLRAILSRESFDGAGFERPPNPVKHRILLKLGAQSNLNSARRRLQELFPEGNLRDYRGAHRNEAQILETVISFLSVTAFLALTLGALAAAIAFREFAEQSLSTLAILRTLGARTRQLAAIFFSQAGVMIVAATALGIALGSLLRVSILALASRYLMLPVAAGWDRAGMLNSAAAAILIVAPVLVEPALWIRRIRPMVILRRAMAAGERPATRAVWRSGYGWIALAISCAAFVLLARWMLDSLRSTVLLTAAIAGAALLTLLLSSAAIRALDWALHRIPLRRRARAPRVRFGLASIAAPGRRSTMLVAALALSSALMMAMFESRATVAQTLIDIIPSNRMNVYVAGFRGSDYTELVALLRHIAGAANVQVTSQVRLQLRALDPVETPVSAGDAKLPGETDRGEMEKMAPLRSDGTCLPDFTLHTSDGVDEACIATSMTTAIGARELRFVGIRARLLRASDGKNAMRSDEWNYYYTNLVDQAKPVDVFPQANRYQTMTVDYYLERRANREFQSGASYLAACSARPEVPGALPALTLTPELARQLNAREGSRIWLAGRTSSFETEVRSIRDLPESERIWAPMQLDCSRLDPETLIHEAGAQVAEDRIPEVARLIRARYPAAAVVTKREVEQTLRGLSGDAIALTRLVGWYAIGCGFAVLLALVAATRATRRTETAIFCALGASRGTMLRIYSVEFAALGILAAAIAGLLAWVVSGAALRVIVQRPATILDWHAIAVAALFGAGAALVGGWLPIFTALSRKPLEVLRGE